MLLKAYRGIAFMPFLHSLEERLSGFIGWRALPHLLALILLLLYTGKYFSYPNIPSPPYGGDYYHQLGYLIHTVDGGSVWESAAVAGEAPGYMPIYPLLGAVPFALFEGLLGSLKAFYVVGILFIFLSYYALLLLFSHHLPRAYSALLAFSAILFLTPQPILKYTDLTQWVVGPLVLYAVFSFLKSSTWRNTLFLGLSFGLMALSHVIGLFAYSLFFGLLLLAKGKDALPIIPKLLVAVLLAFLIGLPYLRWPIQYGFSFAYDRMHLDFYDLSIPGASVALVMKTLGRLFSLPFVIFFIVALWAFYKGERVLMLAALAVLFSFLFLHTDTFYLPPSYVFSLLFVPLTLYYASAGLRSIPYKGALLLFLALAAVGHFIMYNPPFVHSAMPQDVWDMARWIREHTHVNEMILSNKELSFLINAITGRKVVSIRWAHLNNPYIRVWERDRDAAIILYGKDEGLREELLRAYNASYLYWDPNWIPSEWQWDGNQLYPSDPFVVFPYPEDQALLDRAQVPYIRAKFWLDPSQRGPFVRKFDALFILPNYTSPTQPWDSSLNKHLRLLYSTNYNVLYAIQ